MSLDSRIAKLDGDTNWLHEFPNPDNSDHGYKSFYDSIDTTIMGNNTYKVIQGFDVDFPYQDKQNYVFTRNVDRIDTDEVNYVSKDPVLFLKKLKRQKGKDIWLIGGGQINSMFLNTGLIDVLQIFIMPIVLGEGLPLFSSTTDLSKLKLISTKQYSTGAVELTYHQC